MSVRHSVSRSSIMRANKAMMEGKTLDDFNIPSHIKSQIQDRRYTASEINAGYARALLKHETV